MAQWSLVRPNLIWFWRETKLAHIPHNEYLWAEWMNGWMKGWLGRQVGGRINGKREGWEDGWIGGMNEAGDRPSASSRATATEGIDGFSFPFICQLLCFLDGQNPNAYWDWKKQGCMLESVSMTNRLPRATETGSLSPPGTGNITW